MVVCQIGAGALGSEIAIGIAKRSYAVEIPIELSIFDFDTVESRNVGAQYFSPIHIGEPKSLVIGNILREYETVTCNAFNERVTPQNIDAFFKDADIIIDCVDNIDTRHLLWQYGMINGIPILHTGISPTGNGNVQWTYQFNGKKVDTFALSPERISSQVLRSMKDGNHRVVPPCELNGLRSLIINTSLAAVNALFIAIGIDNGGFVKSLESAEDITGTLTTWVTSIKGFDEIKEFRGTI